MDGKRVRDEQAEQAAGPVDLGALLRDIGTLDEAQLGDAVARLLDSPDVTDTLDELRRHIDDLFRRIDSGGAAAHAQPEPELGTEFESHIDGLGRKMDAASRLLAELTDVLESQTERIETIEQQLGDPDYADTAAAERATPAEPSSAAPAVAAAREGGAETDAADGPDPTDALREFLNDRLDRLEGRITDIESRIVDVRTLALERDRHVRSLEERLVALVDSPAPREAAARQGGEPHAVPRFGSEPRPRRGPEPPPPAPPVVSSPATVAHVGGTAVVEEARVVSPPAVPEPSPSTAADAVPNAEPPRANENDSGVAADSSDRLAELVEREVRTRREFREGAVAMPAGEHPTVMVVDDLADARTILSIYLSKTGYNVVTATSAEDCLARLRHHAVDAIVLDARMPGADGSHVCRMLRQDSSFARWSELPIIVYTAYPDEFPRTVVDAWGANDYVVKGGDMLPLITALVRHTRARLGAST